MSEGREGKAGGGKLISLAAKKLAKEIDEALASSKKTADVKKAAMREQQQIDDAINEMLDDPARMEDVSADDFQMMVDNASPDIRARLLGDDSSGAATNETVAMMRDLEPEEVATNLSYFNTLDEIGTYAQGLNANETRRFVSSISDEDYALFDGLEDMVQTLGPRVAKGSGGFFGRLMAPLKELKNAGSAKPRPSDNGILDMLMYQDFEHRKRFQEGGEAVPPEDTYPNIPAEQMEAVEASQLPDTLMESEFVDHTLEQILSEDDLTYLEQQLEVDDRLSVIVDQLVLSAAEFSGAGEVAGPGDGTSDSIPARLSDGEFVFTKKAVDEIGAETLQQMMDEAEAAYDQRNGLATGGMATNYNPLNEQMLSANQMPSLLHQQSYP